MKDYEPLLTGRLANAPREVKDLLADIMIDSILRSDMPEETKIEVKLIKIGKELQMKIHKVINDFGCPLPPTEEGKEVRRKALPARQACLEYLQLMMGGLETFLEQVPAPDIPPEYKDIEGRLKGR